MKLSVFGVLALVSVTQVLSGCGGVSEAQKRHVMKQLGMAGSLTRFALTSLIQEYAFKSRRSC